MNGPSEVAPPQAISSQNPSRNRRLLRRYRQPNNLRNLRHLGADLATVFALLMASVWLCKNYADVGMPFFAVVLIAPVLIVLIGAVQHRLAALGHEGSHGVLFRNRWLNELVSDWVCMFPMFTTTDHYRSLHLGHHRWVNDRERDPEFHNLGRARKLYEFPMHRWQFVTHFIARILWPFSLMRCTWSNMLHGTIGVTQRGANDWSVVRPLFWCGVLHFVATSFCLRTIGITTGSLAYVWMGILGASAIAGIVILAIPTRYFYRSGYPGCYGPKLRSWMRLTFLSILQGGLACGSLTLGIDCLFYFRVFWVVPLLTGFPYFMLLRDAYQHANTDEGRYTNSRVMFPDWFSKWAIFMYGSDYHLTHHLHPGVPHYKLPRLHESLKKRNALYAEEVVETYGIFNRRRTGYPSLLETIETERS